MKQNGIYRGEWAGCSNFAERREELMRNHESDELKSLKAMLDAGWQAKVTGLQHKRPRIQKAKQPKEVIVSIFGGKLKMTFTDYQQKGQGLKVLMEIF